MKKILFTLLIAAFSVASAFAQDELAGIWKSAESIQIENNHFASKEYVFEGNNWHLEKTIYKDSEHSNELYRLRTSGTVVKAKDKPGEMLFTTQKVYITLLTDDQDIISEVGLNYCPLIKEVETDISETGCAHIRSAKRAGEVSKEVSLKGGALKIGRTIMKKSS